MFEERIRAITASLEQLRRRPETADWFGVAKHRFRLNPSLSAAELAVFERQHSIPLSEDYRAFLLLAGNGGAGPYYGLDALSRWDYWFEQEDGSPDLLATPCPFVYEQITSPAWHICDQGCTCVARLIVAGASRGRIFNLDVNCTHPPHFAPDSGLLDWYERWLGLALAGEPPAWFGYDNPACAGARPSVPS
jgi:hypothetical protein